MDSRTHVEFAKRLLPANLSPAGAAALFPQIDRQPATLHRNFAHHITKARALTQMGFELVLDIEGLTNSLNRELKTEYAQNRFREERSRIRAYFSPEELTTFATPSELLLAGQMALISHLYLDTFNQPVQAFTPFKSNCSGQFQLWDRIGDFRYRLYVDGVVEELRKEWLKSSLWKTQFDVSEMLVGMVLRLADLADLPHDHVAVRRSLETSGVDPALATPKVISWLKEVEFELSNLHIRYLG